MLRSLPEVKLESNLLEQGGRKGLYATLIHLSLNQKRITAYSGTIDLLTLGLKEFANHFAVNMTGKEKRSNGLLERNQYLMMITKMITLLMHLT